MTTSLLSWLRGGSGRHSTGRTARRRYFVPRLEILEDRTVPSTFTVTDLADSGPGSLRQAILDANAAGSDNTIAFAVTGYLKLASALPDLTSNLDIQGPGVFSLTISRSAAWGTPDFSIFTVSNGATVTLDGMTIENGAGFYGGAIDNSWGTLAVSHCTLSGNKAWRGGAINNFGNLTITDSTVYGNVSSNDGAGIANFGPLAVTHCTLSGNSTGSLGGAIYNFGSAVLTVTDSTLSGNTAGFGGAIANNSATVAVNRSTVASNSAQVGGGVFNDYGGTVTVTDSTFAFDDATYSGGGGIYNDSGAALMLLCSTFAHNYAAAGGGIANAGTMTARNTILAGNTASTGADLSGDLGSQGHNLIGDTHGGSDFADSDLLNVDPKLGPLQYNGGPTATMALLVGSPAVDAGDNTNVPAYDQRGYTRIVGGTIDIGAFEVQLGVATRLVISAPTSVVAGVPFDIIVTALDAYGHVASGYQGTVSFSTTDPDLRVILPATYTFTASDAGSHTFSGVTTLWTADTQTLWATDTADGLAGGWTLTVLPNG